MATEMSFPVGSGRDIGHFTYRRGSELVELYLSPLYTPLWDVQTNLSF